VRDNFTTGLGVLRVLVRGIRRTSIETKTRKLWITLVVICEAPAEKLFDVPLETLQIVKGTYITPGREGLAFTTPEGQWH
jgi:hypothetical protein